MTSLMKSCPICGREYAEDMSFCLEDGTPLGGRAKATEAVTEEYGAKTAIRPTVAAETVEYKVPAAQEPRRRSNAGIYVVAAILIAGCAVILTAAIGSYFWYKSKRSELAFSANSNPNSNSVNSGRSESSSNDRFVFGSNSAAPSPLPSTNVPKPSPTKPADANLKATDVPAPPSPPLPQPTRATVPKTISGGVLNGKAISLPKPPYPPVARAVRASGSVSVQVLIDEQGNVISASAVSGHPLLRASAVAAAHGAKFSPTVLSGQPVKVSGVITYNFVP
jgi:TonB family protein